MKDAMQTEHDSQEMPVLPAGMRRCAERKTVVQARRKRKRRAKGRRGVALLMVLTAVGLLFVLAQQSREETELYSRAAAVSRDQVQAYYQALSQVNLARVLLHAEPSVRRAITPILAPLMALTGRGLNVPQLPIWEQADLLLGPFRNREAGARLGEMAGVGWDGAKNLGGLTGAEPVRIIDEDAKISINGFERGPHISRRVAQQLFGLLGNPALNPFFENRDADGQFTDRATLVGAMVDYADTDPNSFDTASLGSTVVSGFSGGGQEDNIYAQFRPPYQRRNAPFDSLDELRMVRGLNDDDLWASVIDPSPGSPHRRTVTVWGQGLVNVNTANGQTILALLCAFSPNAPQCTDAMEARRFITGVTMIQGFTLSMGIPMFSSARNFVDTVTGRPPLGPMLTAMGVQPFQITGPQLEQSVTTESKVFSIYAEAVVGAAHARIHAVIDMRMQPTIPGQFLRAASGREAANTSAVIVLPTGTTATASSAGGTVVHWRED